MSANGTPPPPNPEFDERVFRRWCLYIADSLDDLVQEVSTIWVRQLDLIRSIGIPRDAPDAREFGIDAWADIVAPPTTLYFRKDRRPIAEVVQEQDGSIAVYVSDGLIRLVGQFVATVVYAGRTGDAHIGYGRLDSEGIRRFWETLGAVDGSEAAMKLVLTELGPRMNIAVTLAIAAARFVLAHEMAHVLLAHRDSSDPSSTVQSAVYSQSDEYDADDVGAFIVAKLEVLNGYDLADQRLAGATLFLSCLASSEPLLVPRSAVDAAIARGKALLSHTHPLARLQHLLALHRRRDEVHGMPFASLALDVSRAIQGLELPERDWDRIEEVRQLALRAETSHFTACVDSMTGRRLRGADISAPLSYIASSFESGRRALALAAVQYYLHSEPTGTVGDERMTWYVATCVGIFMTRYREEYPEESRSYLQWLAEALVELPNILLLRAQVDLGEYLVQEDAIDWALTQLSKGP